jgi:predicted dienelactone hydrolase
MNFVLDNIITLAHSVDSPSFFQGIDLEHIGTFGHSLGGATAAQIGRDRKEVDAVIVIDGTMLGEVIGFKDGKEILNNTTYPKPILNFYNESHYADAVKNQDNYANMVVVSHAQDTYQVIINGSGHLNFTDLPLVSPVLAGLLGTGDVNAERCIEIMNQDILEFFDHYLKQSNTQINKVRIY